MSQFASSQYFNIVRTPILVINGSLPPTLLIPTFLQSADDSHTQNYWDPNSLISSDSPVTSDTTNSSFHLSTAPQELTNEVLKQTLLNQPIDFTFLNSLTQSSNLLTTIPSHATHHIPSLSVSIPPQQYNNILTFHDGFDFTHSSDTLEGLGLPIKCEDLELGSLMLNPDQPSSPVQPVVKRQKTNSSVESGEEKNFICGWDNCGQSFCTRTSLATHCASHFQWYKTQAADSKQSITYVCKWNNCGEQMSNLRSLAKHLAQENHVGQTPFQTKLESKEQQQQQQQEEKAKKRKTYSCSHPGCGKNFTDSSNRKKHEKTHDANRERFFCTEPGCSKSYSTKTDLNIHLKVHKGEFSHKCTHPNCMKAFVRLSELYAHERTHDNMLPHACVHCGKSFREKSRLKKHEELHKANNTALQNKMQELGLSAPGNVMPDSS